MASSTKLLIRSTDLVNDCFRLNQRFDLAETRLAALESAPKPTTSVKFAASGTHSDRINNLDPAAYLNVIYVEADRNGVQYQSQYVGSVAKWVYVGGTYRRTQAQLASLISTLDQKPNSIDDGMLVYVTDYDHTLRWDSAAVSFTWAPGDQERNCFIKAFMVDPSPSTGWKLCDGNGDDGSPIGVSHPVHYLKPDGTLGSITSATVAPCVPNLVSNPAVLQFGATDTGVNAAVAPTVNTSTLATAAAYTGVTGPVSTSSAQAVIGTNSGLSQQVGSGGAFAAPAGHTHTDAGHSHALASLTDPTHTHSLSGTITINADGMPQYITQRAWFRK